MEEKEKELSCWNHSVLEKPKWEIESNNLHLNILLDFARKPIIHKEKEINVFVVCLEVIRFGGEVFGTVTQMIALNKAFVFLVPYIRLYYPIYDINL